MSNTTYTGRINVLYATAGLPLKYIFTPKNGFHLIVKMQVL